MFPYLFLTLITLISSTIINPPCKKYEFECNTKDRCINLDRYCNGIPDCQDQSDEPNDCTRKFLRLLCTRKENELTMYLVRFRMKSTIKTQN